MNTNRYTTRFYTTPHYAAAESPAVFAVRQMPLATRAPHALGHYAGSRRRFAAAMLRMQNRSNAS